MLTKSHFLLFSIILISIFLCLGCGSTTMETGKISEKKPVAQISAGLEKSAVLSSSLTNLTSLTKTRQPSLSGIDLRLSNIWASKNPGKWFFQRKRIFDTLWNKILK